MSCYHFILLLPLLPLAGALTTPLRRQTAPTSGSTELANKASDTVYMATLTLDGNDYALQLDTGSSDLWIAVLPNATSLPTIFQYASTDRQISANLTYGLGWAAGYVEQAHQLSLAGLDLTGVAFLDAQATQNPVSVYGGAGILGLGFKGLSNVYQILSTDFGDPNLGLPLLSYYFYNHQANPMSYTTFLLGRADDPEQATGTFTINELVPGYENVTERAWIPTYPKKDPTRWNVLLDAIYDANGRSVPLKSTMPGVSAKTNVALLDTGATLSYFPADVVDALYGSVVGARKDEQTGVWSIPCRTKIQFTLQFANGQVFPVDPADVITQSNTNGVADCKAAWRAQNLGAGFGFDTLLGANFLKSVYIQYDYGYSNSADGSEPGVRMLPLVDEINPSLQKVSITSGPGSPRSTLSLGQKIALGFAAGLILCALISWALLHRQKKEKVKREHTRTRLGQLFFGGPSAPPTLTKMASHHDSAYPAAAWIQERSEEPSVNSSQTSLDSAGAIKLPDTPYQSPPLQSLAYTSPSTGRSLSQSTTPQRPTQAAQPLASKTSGTRSVRQLLPALQISSKIKSARHRDRTDNPIPPSPSILSARPEGSLYRNSMFTTNRSSIETFAKQPYQARPTGTQPAPRSRESFQWQLPPLNHVGQEL